jgi:hypothetical protein
MPLRYLLAVPLKLLLWVDDQLHDAPPPRRPPQASITVYRGRTSVRRRGRRAA